MIFRLCWVYGARGQDFLLTMMRLAREREKLRVVCDQIGSPTWSRMMAEATALALKQVFAAGDLGAFQGVYHLSAAGETTCVLCALLRETCQDVWFAPAGLGAQPEAGYG